MKDYTLYAGKPYIFYQMTTDRDPKKIGRPTKLTPALQEKICAYIAAGNYLTTAYSAVGIDTNTFNLWLNNANQGKVIGGIIGGDNLRE